MVMTGSNIRRGIRAGLLTTIAVSGVAHAQSGSELTDAQSPPQAASSVAPDQDVWGVEEIVVTARKREENVQDIPAAITAYSAEALIERNVQNVGDLVRITPGMARDRKSTRLNSSH